jgi:VWFA-related protein
MRNRVTFAATLLTLSLLAPSLALPTRAQSQQTQTQTPPTNATPQATPTPQDDSDDGDVVRITANLVQFDAVVTDKKGQPVTDLRPEDFEVSVDNKRQTITNFSYVATLPGGAATATAPPTTTPRAADKSAPPLPPARIKPGDVRRTVALVVDDLGTSFETMVHVREALKKFVGEQMQPGDLVAIMRTSSGMGALQQFTSDKATLYRAIERVRWYPMGRAGVGAFAPMEADNFAGVVGGTRANISGDDPLTGVSEYREEIFSVGTLGALNFIVSGMQELPGRKSVVMFSDGIRIYNHRDNTGAQPVLDSLRRLVDLANRASVVVYTVDSRGLPALGLTAADNTFGRTSAQVRDAISDRSLQYLDTQDGLNYLATETGGLFLHDTNDLGGAVRKVLDDQKGYYLIGFRPDESVFESVKGRRRFNDLDVKVKRSGLKVRSRSGFVGMTDAEARPPRTTRLQQLVGALSSPFASGDVRLRLTSLVGGDRANGAFVTSLMHIDMSGVKFTEEADGWQKAVIDIIALTFGDGGVVDEVNRTETIRARGETLERARRNGLIYTMRVPVKNPGAYQLRVAVRDASTEKLGSASQFIEVPDLKKDRLALSGIIMQSGSAAASAEGVGNESDPQGNPAVRHFHVGEEINYFYNVYNARADKATGRPHVQTQMRLFRDREQVYEGALTDFDMARQTDLTNLHAGMRVRLSELQPGEYVLQVTVTDLNAPEKRRAATQWIDFEVVK